MLKMMMDLCQQSADSAILFYDEMASVISSSNIDHEIIVSQLIFLWHFCSLQYRLLIV